MLRMRACSRPTPDLFIPFAHVAYIACEIQTRDILTLRWAFSCLPHVLFQVDSMNIISIEGYYEYILVSNLN